MVELNNCKTAEQEFFTPIEVAALRTTAAQGGRVNAMPDSPWQADDASYFASSDDLYRVRERYPDEGGSAHYMILWEMSPGKRMKYDFDYTLDDFIDRYLVPSGDEWGGETLRAYLFACLRDRTPFYISEAIEKVEAMLDAHCGLAN
jgi:hypothetical protein